jgi:hypothetical protein
MSKLKSWHVEIASLKTRKERTRKMSAKIIGIIRFSGDDRGRNPDACADALRAAGFAVTRMDDRFKRVLKIPGDEEMEATKTGTPGDVWKEIDKIIEPFGGDCQECGEISDDHIPFAGLHKLAAH